MDLKITVETNQADLIEKILKLVKGKSAKVKLEGDRTIESKLAGDFLDSLTKKHPLLSIKDPKEWQREIRKDRPLPF